MPHLFILYFNFRLMEKSKTLETSLVLTTAFLVVYIITENVLFLYLAFSLGIIGIFIKPLAKIIAFVWFKLADILNYFVSKIILGALFFVILFPISILYRIMNGNKLNQKNVSKSIWKERMYTYSKNDLENIW